MVDNECETPHRPAVGAEGTPMKPGVLRPVVGGATVALIAAVFLGAVIAFNGGFADHVAVTVLSQRAGLVMDPDAKVKMRGVQVGRVDAIEELPDGQAALHLSMNPSQLQFIPANVHVDIASTTVFGAKSVELIPPDHPSAQTMHAGQVLDAEHVTVEINTVFEQLTSVLAQIEPTKLNETLATISRALSGRGDKVGQMLANLDVLLAKVEPALPALGHELSVAPRVMETYADAAPDLLRTIDNASKVSQTVVDEHDNLDALLVSVIGLAHVGNQFLADNGPPLTSLVHLLLPTTDLVDRYNSVLTCATTGLADLYGTEDPGANGVGLSAALTWGRERYRYPGDLPKVAAKGGPHCEVLPVGFEEKPPYIVTDTGTNPYKYGNQGLLLNSDALKQFLYGPIDGPPRNTAQVGQPG
jgi:phospholipid/cholesterol/gamma-HCH transport system substrate-binding protein